MAALDLECEQMIDMGGRIGWSFCGERPTRLVTFPGAAALALCAEHEAEATTARAQIAIQPAPPVVHAIGWAAHGELEILCDGTSDEAKWGADPPEGTVVFETEGGRLYTFEADHITCASCRAAHRRGEDR